MSKAYHDNVVLNFLSKDFVAPKNWPMPFNRVIYSHGRTVILLAVVFLY